MKIYNKDNWHIIILFLTSTIFWTHAYSCYFWMWVRSWSGGVGGVWNLIGFFNCYLLAKYSVISYIDAIYGLYSIEIRHITNFLFFYLRTISTKFQKLHLYYATTGKNYPDRPSRATLEITDWIKLNIVGEILNLHDMCAA